LVKHPSLVAKPPANIATCIVNLVYVLAYTSNNSG